MSASMVSPYTDIDNLLHLLYRLNLSGLKDILRREGLPVSGLKAVLQGRLTGREYYQAVLAITMCANTRANWKLFIARYSLAP